MRRPIARCAGPLAGTGAASAELRLPVGWATHEALADRWCAEGAARRWTARREGVSEARRDARGAHVLRDEDVPFAYEYLVKYN